jgi:hypothetical protein
LNWKNRKGKEMTDIKEDDFEDDEPIDDGWQDDPTKDPEEPEDDNEY